MPDHQYDRARKPKPAGPAGPMSGALLDEIEYRFRLRGEGPWPLAVDGRQLDSGWSAGVRSGNTLPVPEYRQGFDAAEAPLERTSWLERWPLVRDFLYELYRPLKFEPGGAARRELRYLPSCFLSKWWQHYRLHDQRL